MPTYPKFRSHQIFLFAGLCSLWLACSPASTDPAEVETTSGAEVEGHDQTNTAEPVSECGPQAPRDITVSGGDNTMGVPQGETPNLCNVHFHDPFEHAGFQWDGETHAASGEPVCQTVDDGAEVEFHWVYTNCDLPDPPMPGLENCVCDRADMVLRVFAQGYVVGGDSDTQVSQPTEGLTQYAGSTTGPSYDEQTCSPARVNWEVNPNALPLSRAALGNWCDNNPWQGEDHPHGSRAPVERPDWLSPFTP